MNSFSILNSILCLFEGSHYSLFFDTAKTREQIKTFGKNDIQSLLKSIAIPNIEEALAALSALIHQSNVHQTMSEIEMQNKLFEPFVQAVLKQSNDYAYRRPNKTIILQSPQGNDLLPDAVIVDKGIPVESTLGYTL